MEPRAVSIILFLALSFLASADTATTSAFFTSLQPLVNITQFSVTPSSINQGATADFSVTFNNYGTGSAIVNATAEIRDAGGTVVDTVAYDPVAVDPSSTLSVVKTWSSGTLPSGIYTAYVNGTYNTDNLTNTMSASFVIVIPSPPVPPGGGAGGQPGKKPEPPQVLPPSIKPTTDIVRFVKGTVVKEMLAGTGDAETFTIENTGEENVALGLVVDGVDEGWVVPRDNQFVLMPHETRDVNLGVSVPADAEAGNYIVRIAAQGKGVLAREFMVLRVKSYAEGYTDPVTLKSVRVDFKGRESTVRIGIRNLGGTAFARVNVREAIPGALSATGAAISFKDKRGVESTIGGSKVIDWTLSDVGPKEEAAITYTIGSVITEYTTYANWYVRQVDFGAPREYSDLIKIVDITVPSIEQGGTGEVSASIMYAGVEPMEVLVMLEVPAGFEAQQGMAKTVLIPRGVTNVKFTIKTGAASLDSHLLRVVIVGDDFNIAESSTIIVTPQAGTPTA
ncbi:MAG: hypothetical protein NT157_02880, partial [Candidatus Micrarchaeota archaeon]|nr:hypothetical protein [Candidatus Micrarchaeota archaeon]